MAKALLLALLVLSRLVGGLAARVTSNASAALPWKSGAVGGALLGHILAGHAVVGVPALESDQSGEPISDLRLGLHGMLSDVLIGGPDSPDEALVLKLLNNLRPSTTDDELAAMLEASFRDAQVQRSSSLVWSTSKRESMDELILPYRDGSHRAEIRRIWARDHGKAEGASALQHILWNMQQANSFPKMFLGSLSQSHSLDELLPDTDAEVLIMMQPHMGTLKDYVAEHDLRLNDLLRLFLRTFVACKRLFVSEVPHNSEITMDKIYVIGEVADPEVVLCPSIIAAESTQDSRESFLADARQLGSILRLLLDRAWPPSMMAKVEVLRAFGLAMESGALEDGGISEYKQVLGSVISDEVSESRLELWRVDFLRRVAAVEGGTTTEEERAKGTLAAPNCEGINRWLSFCRPWRQFLF